MYICDVVMVIDRCWNYKDWVVVEQSRSSRKTDYDVLTAKVFVSYNAVEKREIVLYRTMIAQQLPSLT